MLSGDERLPLSQNDIDALLDPKGQKGVHWRMQKLQVIRKLVKEGKTKAWVVWFLRTRTGLTSPTARGLVEDAFLEEPKGESQDWSLVNYSIHSKKESKATSRFIKEIATRLKKDRVSSAKEIDDALSGTIREGTRAKKPRLASAKSQQRRP